MRLAHLSILLLALLPQVGMAQLDLSITQPSGPGSVTLTVTDAGRSAELFVLISSFPATPTGSGPFLGLSLMGSDQLIAQLLSPPGTEPVHVFADPSGRYDWSQRFPPIGIQLSFDVVAMEWSPVTGIVQLTPVEAVTLDF